MRLDSRWGAFGLLLVGCQGVVPSGPGAQPAPEPPGSAASADAQTVELALDETVSVGPLRLRWTELNDSRCPLGVQCAWEGQAVATVEVSGGDPDPQRVELVLRPGVEPGAVAVEAHALRLLEVEPYPREGFVPERGEYVATVEVLSL